MLVSLTVGKVDAGVAVLLTEDKRLIEFPSILLPPDISSGSMVDIDVARNYKAEADAQKAFHELQSEIFRTFGQRTPSAPILKCRNATQTSVVLEWEPIDIATAELRSLTLYRNGNKAGTIPKPSDQHSTKLSGLAVDTEYEFHLVLKTSAGTFSSEKLKVHTHKMTDLSGITITPGHMPASLRESLQRSVERIGAKISDNVRIDTTHFVCTEGRGPSWEKAVENNIPVVVPDWIPDYGTSPLMSPRTEVTPPTPERLTHDRNANGGAPPPPPKDDVSSRSSSVEPKKQTDEQKARSEDDRPYSEKEKRGDSEDEDSEPEPSDGKAMEAGLPQRSKPGQASAEDDEDGASFQEVQL
ncbi:chitin biosynthesis protein CHS5 [Pyrenophora tritici-repentis]|nr:fn3-2 multi-domain protein [Pyrenophora tritici-repentis]PZC98179.1 chitin biosynthesis protein CHS5 [Pyrenophora tritici-repentis]PZD42239.1 chitin biosynthesis protein CHS5 [Pyrenophora tritici-repentis]